MENKFQRVTSPPAVPRAAIVENSWEDETYPVVARPSMVELICEPVTPDTLFAIPVTVEMS